MYIIKDILYEVKFRFDGIIRLAKFNDNLNYFMLLY